MASIFCLLVTLFVCLFVSLFVCFALFFWKTKIAACSDYPDLIWRHSEEMVSQENRATSHRLGYKSAATAAMATYLLMLLLERYQNNYLERVRPTISVPRRPHKAALDGAATGCLAQGVPGSALRTRLQITCAWSLEGGDMPNAVELAIVFSSLWSFFPAPLVLWILFGMIIAALLLNASRGIVSDAYFGLFWLPTPVASWVDASRRLGFPPPQEVTQSTSATTTLRERRKTLRPISSRGGGGEAEELEKAMENSLHEYNQNSRGQLPREAVPLLRSIGAKTFTNSVKLLQAKLRHCPSDNSCFYWAMRCMNIDEVTQLRTELAWEAQNRWFDGITRTSSVTLRDLILADPPNDLPVLDITPASYMHHMMKTRTWAGPPEIILSVLTGRTSKVVVCNPTELPDRFRLSWGYENPQGSDETIYLSFNGTHFDELIPTNPNQAAQLVSEEADGLVAPEKGVRRTKDAEDSPELAARKEERRSDADARKEERKSEAGSHARSNTNCPKQPWPRDKGPVLKTALTDNRTMQLDAAQQRPMQTRTNDAVKRAAFTKEKPRTMVAATKAAMPHTCNDRGIRVWRLYGKDRNAPAEEEHKTLPIEKYLNALEYMQFGNIHRRLKEKMPESIRWKLSLSRFAQIKIVHGNFNASELMKAAANISLVAQRFFIEFSATRDRSQGIEYLQINYKEIDKENKEPRYVTWFFHTVLQLKKEQTAPMRNEEPWPKLVHGPDLRRPAGGGRWKVMLTKYKPTRRTRLPSAQGKQGTHRSQ